MRLFVALEIPSAVRTNLAAVTAGLRALESESPGKKSRWTPPENLHVTLKFIGNVAPEKLDQIRTLLTRVRSERPVELRFRGLGFFPDAKRPRVVWAGVTGSPNLAVVAADIDRALTGPGFSSEERAFTPHLTLARTEPAAFSPKLRAAIEKDAARDLGQFCSNQFHLIESKLKPTGAEYTTLQSFAFAAEA